MPIALILLLMWAASLSSCVAHGMTVQEGEMNTKNEQIFNFGVRDQVKTFICSHVDCPDHISVDQLKLDGYQVAEVHVNIHYNF